MKRIIIMGICAAPLLFASCGGGESEGEGNGADTTATEPVIETVVSNYVVDTAATIINWNNFDGEEKDHVGTVKASEGSIEVTTTGDVSEITGASLVVDMNTIQEGSEKLVGHLMSEDFFNVANYATTTFAFDRHENDMIYGTVNVIGKDLAVEAPATVNFNGEEVTVEVGEFTLDFAQLQMPFFEAEKENVPEEQHDTKIGFTATIVGASAH